MVFGIWLTVQRDQELQIFWRITVFPTKAATPLSWKRCLWVDAALKTWGWSSKSWVHLGIRSFGSLIGGTRCRVVGNHAAALFFCVFFLNFFKWCADPLSNNGDSYSCLPATRQLVWCELLMESTVTSPSNRGGFRFVGETLAGRHQHQAMWRRGETEQLQTAEELYWPWGP